MQSLITLASSMTQAFGFQIENREPGREIGGGGKTNFDFSPDRPPGPFGPAGADGADGADGAPGPPGQSLEGAAGNRGETGEKGTRGPAGAAGPPGEAGTDKAGIPGPRGPRGPAGSNGPKGATGPQGFAGRDGVSIPGPQGPEGPQGPPGLKTAIMPAHGRCVGLIAQEAREVLFEDILRIQLPAHCSRLSIPLDPIFTACCEPGSLFISAALPCYPVHIDAKLQNQQPSGARQTAAGCPKGSEAHQSAISNQQSSILLRLPPHPLPLTITLTIHGIRLGMRDIESRTYTPADLAANEAFYAQAYRS